MGFLLTTIRDDAGVSALTTRIRGGEPAKGDALGPGSYQRFVVLVNLGHDRSLTGMQSLRVAARCYGTTYADASLVAGAVSDAIHNIGPRLNAAGVGIWRMYDDVGMGAEADPDTGQPHEDIVIEVVAATKAVAGGPIG